MRKRVMSFHHPGYMVKKLSIGADQALADSGGATASVEMTYSDSFFSALMTADGLAGRSSPG